MKNYTLPSVLLLIFAFGCQKEDVDSKKNRDNLPQYSSGAQLQQVTLYGLESSSLPGNVIESYEYDENDRVSRIVTPGVGGMDDIAQYQSFEYDSEDRVSSVSTYVANTGEPNGFLLIEVKNIFYSGDGVKTKESVENPQIGLKKERKFSYEGILLAKSEEFDNKGLLERYTVFEYNDSGTLKKETAYSSTGELNNYVIHVYDGELRRHSSFYSFNNELIKEEKRAYDSNSNLVELKSINKALWLSSMSYRLEYTYVE
ncbi:MULTISPECIES: hypothetical protein [unclassified Imperialibacter]|uniref:hypothetical protein n=1 Tax=unclassified Imperialibacter TaxID=2629706 RepID=UPI001251A860|nr:MULTISPECIES: hypothetical protein [unclassified Imperialibacter]CAD5282635.1 conserved hypothetical protein [Imperialibacter sp. 75]CAD5297487.1 conserved hypothetical protein [Imperialibacter sp. 89]VVT02847.1 conserved hypothetical protein [Imperialibacter sp. EC-SDR9]